MASLGSGLASVLQSLPMIQRKAATSGLPVPMPGYDGEMPEFSVRDGSSLPPPIPYRQAEDQSQNFEPVAGDRENAILHDMRSGGSPGTGLSHADTPSTLSSTPSGGPSAPPSGHGDDNDILTHVPQIQMPDINSMPGTEHINKLTADLDAARHPAPVHGWRKFAQYAAELGPTALGAALGGARGAGAAAEGTVQAMDTRRKASMDQQNELLRQIQEEQAARTGQYQAAGHVATTNAQLQSNALIRDAILRGQKEIASGHDQTRLSTTNASIDSRETIAGNKLDHQKVVDQAKMELQAAQTELTRARTSGVAAQIALAERRVQIAQQFADASTARAQVAQDSYERDTFGTQGGAPIPGAPTNDQGQVIGFKPYAATGPTGATKTKLDQAGGIDAAKKELVDYVAQHKDTLGPIMGRVHNLEELFGTDSPESRELRGRFSSWIALHPAFHGFRGTNALREFENAVGGYKQTPEGFIAAINGMTGGVDTAAKGMRTARGGYSGPDAAKPRGHGIQSTPPEPPMIEYERGPDGKPRRKQR